MSLHATISRAIGVATGTTAQLQLVVPLARWGTATMSTTRKGHEAPETRLHYSRSVSTKTGVGWTLGASAGNSDASVADITWRNPVLQVQAGASRVSGRVRSWAGASGAVVAMGGGLFAANRVSDGFVLVDTDGYAGVPVLQDNQLVGRTNRRGHLLVPWVSAYYAATYEIDPLSLPLDVHVPAVQQRAAVHRHSGTVLRFPIERRRTAAIRVVMPDGTPAAVGVPGLHQESGQRLVVGWGGIVYLDNLQERNTLVLQTGAGTSCRVQFSMDVEPSSAPTVGPLVCQ